MRFQGKETIDMSYEIPAANAFILQVSSSGKSRLNIHPQPVFTCTMVNESWQFTIKDLIFDRNQDPDYNAISGLSGIIILTSTPDNDAIFKASSMLSSGTK